MSAELISDNIDNKKDLGGLGTVLLLIWIFVILMLWGFAFFPAEEFSNNYSSLIARTQYVCFGTQINGLPATQGWMLLILGPLALLSFMWATHTEELYAIPYYLKSSRPAKIIFAIFIICIFIEAFWFTQRLIFAYKNTQDFTSATSHNKLPDDYPRYNKNLPSFSLINQNGEKISSDFLKNKVTLLTFTFGHCSTICPMLIRDVTEAQRRVTQSGKFSNIVSIFITLDPWRDTPRTLPGLAKTWSLPENSYMLSGSPEEVQKALKDFEIASQRSKKTGDITHAAQVMIVDPNLKIAYTFLNPSVDWIVSAANRIIGK